MIVFKLRTKISKERLKDIIKINTNVTIIIKNRPS